jgi:hypothetical protein
MLVLEPSVCPIGFPILLKQSVETMAELHIAQCSLDLFLRNRPQDDPWILRGFPEFFVERFPQLVRGMVPGPVEIERQLNQRIDTINL